MITHGKTFSNIKEEVVQAAKNDVRVLVRTTVRVRSMERLRCVLPARTETAWRHDYVMNAEVRYHRGRIRFGGCESSAPFPRAIAVFKPSGDY